MEDVKKLIRTGSYKVCHGQTRFISANQIKEILGLKRIRFKSENVIRFKEFKIRKPENWRVHSGTKFINKRGLREILTPDSELYRWIVDEYLNDNDDLIFTKGLDDIVSEPFSIVVNGTLWIHAQPFVKLFSHRELNERVSIENRRRYGEITFNLSPNIDPNGKMINEAGLYQFVSTRSDVKKWITDCLLPKLRKKHMIREVDELNGRLVKIYFGGVLWLSASPIAIFFGYSEPYQAMRDYVSERNVKKYEDIKSERFSVAELLHYSKKKLDGVAEFFNEAGLYELILGLPKFRSWITGTLLTKLREERRYDMKDAPPLIHEQMDIVGRICDFFYTSGGVNDEVSTFDGVKIDYRGVTWMLARSAVIDLGFLDYMGAICKYVSAENQIDYGKICSGRNEFDESTKFINEEGLNELVLVSKKEWITSVVLPTLRRDSCYNVTSSAALHVREYEKLANKIIKFYFNGTLWVLAKQFIHFLGFEDTLQALIDHVSVENQMDYFSAIFQTYHESSYITTEQFQIMTKFINMDGLCELMDKSRKSNVKQFKECVMKSLRRDVAPNSIIATPSTREYDELIDKVVKITYKGTMWMLSSTFTDILGHDGYVSSENVIDFGSDAKFINEVGLRELILTPKKPVALYFLDWVTNVLLPKLRNGEGELQTKLELMNDKLFSENGILNHHYENITKMLNQYQTEILKKIGRGSSCVEVYHKELVYDNDARWHCYYIIRVESHLLELARRNIRVGFDCIYHTEDDKIIRACDSIRERIKYSKDLSNANLIICRHPIKEFIRAINGKTINN